MLVFRTNIKDKIMKYLQALLYFSLILAPLPLQANNWTEIQSQKTLRVLTWAGHQHFLPQTLSAITEERQAIEAFSALHSLKIEFIPVSHYRDLIPALLANKGDIIIANMTITTARKKQVMFSEPLTKTAEYIVIDKNNETLADAQSLNGREIAVQKGTTYSETALGLQKVYPQLKIRYLDESLSSEDIHDLLAAQKIDLTLEDGNTLVQQQKYRKNLQRSLQASGSRLMAWATNKTSHQLLSHINAFLQQESLIVNNKTQAPKNQNRWQQIKQEKVIRFVMRNNMASYFIWKGDLYGFNYELAKHFTQQNNIRYQVIVAPDNHSLLQYVIDGKADVALGFITPNKQREKMGIAFSRPYHYASEIVVTRSNDNSINDIKDIKNREFNVRQSSSYWHTLSDLKKKHAIKIIPVNETLETEDIIDHVAAGDYDLTVSDSHILDLELTWRDDIKGTLALSKPRAQSWAVSIKNPELLNKVNHFIKSQYRGLFYNINYKKYFKNQSRINKIRDDYVALKRDGRLSPYDDLVKKHAQQYDFDWRLLVSQMFQESRFNPNAKSWSGAQGLFQVMPRTAEELEISNLKTPENGILAGVKYMNWVRERAKHMKPKDEQELLWFTLASYNAGAGHVRDAVSLAKKQGWQADTWFDNVEKAMLLLSKDKYAAQARYGYVRGQEPVDYVRLIKKRYEAYIHVSPLN